MNLFENFKPSSASLDHCYDNMLRFNLFIIFLKDFH